VRLPKVLKKWLIYRMPRRLAGQGWQAAGGKKISEKYPRYEQELEGLLDALVIGNPEKPLRHVSKSGTK
jgi:hypothetical protein